eukprot:1160578-Lingulodinium_polyedra.AAC.1
MPPAPQRVALGVRVRLEQADVGIVVHEAKEETIADIQELAEERIRAKKCTPAQASKIRGKAGWAAGMAAYGRAVRFALGPLKKR